MVAKRRGDAAALRGLAPNKGLLPSGANVLVVCLPRSDCESFSFRACCEATRPRQKPWPLYRGSDGHGVMWDPKPSWVSLTSSQQRELDEFARIPGWRMLSQESIPSVFPESFRRKFDSAIMIAAPTSSGGTYLVCNALRADFRAKAVDQEPFAVIFHSTGADPSGMFLHHGNWPHRTQPPPAGFWDHIQKSGVGNFFLTDRPSGLTSGALDQLPPGHREAFDSAVSHYRSEWRKDG